MSYKKVKRRDFIRNTSVFVAGLLVYRIPTMANPLIPEVLNGEKASLNQAINSEWVKSLYERSTVTTYLKSKNELSFIGMPVGGINCGTVYLGGDGRLWLWDIFNKNQEGIEPKLVPWNTGVLDGGNRLRSRDGACYVEPSKDIRPLDQGFAIKIKSERKTIIKQLKSEDWEEIAFEATYPQATIKYTDKELPVAITLQAFSPFIPLDEDNSNLPATVLSFQVTNNSKETISIELIGWLENAVNKFSTKSGDGERINKIIEKENLLSVFSKFIATDENKFSGAGDSGSMCLSLIGTKGFANPSLDEFMQEDALFSKSNKVEALTDAGNKLIGGIGTSQKIKAGKTVKIDYLISWYFPNVGERINVPDAKSGNYYASKFSDALAVSNYIADKFSFLSSNTELWKKTWYDSTLPWWFLERTFMNISTMATTTSHRFATGRSWAWEGVGACEGNCTHVWQYAQAVGRIFPALEKDNRERVDLGISLMENGGIWFRGEYDKRPAIDGQAGTVLRIYREHQMSTDDTFLRKNWTNVKKATQFIMDQDKNKDGMEDTPMENTLDAVWEGEIAWIVGLCIAAIKAGQMMAEEMNDTVFAAKCKEYVEIGKKNMEEKLFNGEYFIHRPDAKLGRKNLGSYNTCHIDQVYGQAWAFQVGLDRVLDKEKTVSALQALWKYNFKSDVGPYIKEHTGGRPLALPGEGGMILNTNPYNEPKPYGEDVTWQLGYFHECMSGFEHQVAAHMIAEGMVDEGLELTKAIHDRYHAAKRNPFNEIECSDHYSRAMASYGTFITACGFEYHGPKGYIRFAPKWDKENFKVPFTTAEGWGTYNQIVEAGKQIHKFELKYGSLKLELVSLEKLDLQKAERVSVMLESKKLPFEFTQEGSEIKIKLLKPITIKTNQTLILILD